MSDQPITLDYQRPLTPKMDPLAIFAFILGIISFVPALLITWWEFTAIANSMATHKTHNPNPVAFFLLPWLPGLLAIALAVLSIVHIARSQGRRRGLVFAILAIITGLAEPLLATLAVLYVVFALARSLPH